MSTIFASSEIEFGADSEFRSRSTTPFFKANTAQLASLAFEKKKSALPTTSTVPLSGKVAQKKKKSVSPTTSTVLLLSVLLVQKR